MKNYINKIIFPLTLFFFSENNVAAQNKNLGINTTNPQSLLHIDGLTDNPKIGTVISTAQQSNDIIVNTNGKMGVGNINPKVKLDIRDANNANSEIGIGDTDLSASISGEGAFKYDKATKTMQYSNGLVWVKLASQIMKAVVIANKTSSTCNKGTPAGPVSSNLPPYTVNYLTDWVEKYDNLNSFDPINGSFKAPNDGVYVASFTVALDPTIISNAGSNNGSFAQVEAVWEQYDNTNGLTAGNIVNRVKCAVTFPANTSNVPATYANPINVGSNCTSSFYLRTGERILPVIYISVNGSNNTLISSGNYNNLTIAQQ
ncbi:hypothetical protein [Chryseobacterium sp. MEBOG07]|uniref:hypothetical protein n=1 Tax=Chryseobacterium sp. MEBOG07 TaxID=2879939 RepID=UPI001F240899|nr:hypothetical protein [Chryseobacterium sp. MEBOG07]UKB78344.1 hypothetical protein LF886_17935 [Chryseobacterium sp. MEBOG07]